MRAASSLCVKDGWQVPTDQVIPRVVAREMFARYVPR